MYVMDGRCIMNLPYDGGRDAQNDISIHVYV
jgi:hypothetical protein